MTLPTEYLVEDARITRLEKELAELKLAQRRSESFAGAGFVLLLSLIRELLHDGQMDEARAAGMVKEAIRILRTLYRIDDTTPFEGDRFDLEKLVDLMRNLEQERPAEDILNQILKALQKQGSAAGPR